MSVTRHSRAISDACLRHCQTIAPCCVTLASCSQRRVTSASLERSFLDGPRLVRLGLLELGEPVGHLIRVRAWV